MDERDGVVTFFVIGGGGGNLLTIIVLFKRLRKEHVHVYTRAVCTRDATG